MKNIINKLKKFLKLSIVKTIQMNIYYFGIGGVVHPYIIVSKNVKIINLNGIVKIDNPSIACVRLGFGSVGIIDTTT